jgi:deazaflavin-dependent oxidoreductase (nitroreductase family)
MRLMFKILNKLFMVPLFRLGLGHLFGNPVAGYVMVLKVIGRKTGKLRYVPLNYTIWNGSVYCLAGFGRSCPWFLNLQAIPDIDVILPGGAIAGHVEEVTDQAERSHVLRQILKNAGFATIFEGYVPFVTDLDRIAAKMPERPVLRIRPTGLGNGACDPGGWAWVWPVVATVVVVALIMAVVL